MKTKNESKFLPATSSGSWRNTDKGMRVVEKGKRPKSGPLFKIAGYVRLSPSGDEREEGSLVSHPQRIKQFVEAKNIQNDGSWGEIVDWYVDKDYSGKDMNRPAFQRMLTDLKSGHVNAVVVTELSRLSRFVKDFCEIQEFFKTNRIAFFSLRESFDTSTPAGELMLMQCIAFAQFERSTIVDRIKRGARARAERGLANGYIPLGFSAVDHKPNYRAIDETERAVVEMIFRKTLELKKISHVVAYLNDNGYRTKEFVTKVGGKAGGNRWTLGTIYSVLTNRAYIGEREVNKRFRSVDQTTLKEEERYFYVDAQWEPLISKELFYDVQRLMEQNRKKARKYVHEYRLTGLIKCAECGGDLVGKSGSGKNAKYFYYGHKRKMLVHGDTHLNRCKYENISAPMLEETIVSRLKNLSDDADLLKELARVSVTESKAKTEHQKSMIAAKEQERRKLSQKLDNLYESIADTEDKTLRIGLSEKASDVQLQLKQVEETYLLLKSEYESLKNVVDLSAAFEYLKVFRDGAFEAQPVAVQSEILKMRIRRIVMLETGVAMVEIYGRKPEMVLLGSEKLQTQKNPTTLGCKWSGVLTDSNLVGQSCQPTRFCKCMILLGSLRPAAWAFMKRSSNSARRGCRPDGLRPS